MHCFSCFVDEKTKFKKQQLALHNCLMWDLKFCLSAHKPKIPRWKHPTLVLLIEGTAGRAIWRMCCDFTGNRLVYNLNSSVFNSRSMPVLPTCQTLRAACLFYDFPSSYCPKCLFAATEASILQPRHLNVTPAQLCHHTLPDRVSRSKAVLKMSK